MTITLYTFRGDNRELAKALENPVAVDNVELIEPTNLISPVIKLRVENFTPDLNYLRIPDFNRFYYIDEAVYNLGGYVALTCRCDVLMSFSADIKAAYGVISRAGRNYNVLLGDTCTVPQSNSSTVNKLLSGGELINQMTADNRCFVLSVYGGGAF